MSQELSFDPFAPTTPTPTGAARARRERQQSARERFQAQRRAAAAFSQAQAAEAEAEAVRRSRKESFSESAAKMPDPFSPTFIGDNIAGGGGVGSGTGMPTAKTADEILMMDFAGLTFGSAEDSQAAAAAAAVAAETAAAEQESSEEKGEELGEEGPQTPMSNWENLKGSLVNLGDLHAAPEVAKRNAAPAGSTPAARTKGRLTLREAAELAAKQRDAHHHQQQQRPQAKGQPFATPAQAFTMTPQGHQQQFQQQQFQQQQLIQRMPTGFASPAPSYPRMQAHSPAAAVSAMPPPELAAAMQRTRPSSQRAAAAAACAAHHAASFYSVGQAAMAMRQMQGTDDLDQRSRAALISQLGSPTATHAVAPRGMGATMPSHHPGMMPQSAANMSPGSDPFAGLGSPSNA